nr:hypothetical protein [Tanacetum cinerariifolium]
MKAHPKHIDWGKVIATNEIMDGDEEEEAKVAKASEDMKLSIMKEKFLTMVESKNARVKDYTKLVVTDGMVDYVLEKYGNKWKSEDGIAYVILEDLWLKYRKYDKGNGKGKGKLVEDNKKGKEAEHQHLKVNKDDNGKRKVHDIQNRVGSVEVELARAINVKWVDDHDLDTLDLENKIKNLKEDFGRLLKVKKAKESKKAKKTMDAKKAREAELAKQAKQEAKKAKEEELKAKKAKEAKEAMLAELKAKKAKKAKNAKEAMLAEVV